MERQTLSHPLYSNVTLDITYTHTEQVAPIGFTYAGGTARLAALPDTLPSEQLALAARALSLRNADAGLLVSRTEDSIERLIGRARARLGIATTAGIVALAFESHAYHVTKPAHRYHMRPREVDVLRLTAAGLEAEEIGIELGISTLCVHAYRKHMRHQLPPVARNNVGLVTLGYMNKLLQPGDVTIRRRPILQRTRQHRAGS